jgi:hypothetical protein
MLLHQIKGCVWLYQCDWCQKKFEAPISKSRSQTQGCSRSCGSKASRVTVKANLLEKHGVTNVSQLPETRAKVKKTTLERFGVECSWQNTDVKNRIKKTMIERYGADSPWRVPEIRARIEADNVQKYGVKHVWESAEIREKSKQTMIELYGVDNPQKSPEIQAQTKRTMLERYGSENPQQVAEIISRTKQTCLKRYGASNPFGSTICREKSRQTLQSNYGVDHPSKSPEIQQKILRSFLKNGKGFVSRSELRCLTVLRELYDDVTQQVSINGWMIDFYIKSIDTYVQFDGVYWHGLTLSPEQLLNPRTKRERDIVKKWQRDQEQVTWFLEQGKRLVRLTDEQFKFWEDIGEVKNNIRNVLGNTL